MVSSSFWPLCCLSFELRLLITPFGIFKLLVIVWSVLLRSTASDYLFDMLKLFLWPLCPQRYGLRPTEATFLASSLFIKKIEWPWYLTIHVYVVSHFLWQCVVISCDNVWSFLVTMCGHFLWQCVVVFSASESISFFFNCLFISVSLLKTQEGWYMLYLNDNHVHKYLQ